MPLPFIPQFFDNTTDDLLYQNLIALRQLIINTAPAVVVTPGQPIVYSVGYWGTGATPTTQAQILAGNLIGFVTGSDVTIDFTTSGLMVPWFAQLLTEPVKHYVYMTPDNNFTIGANGAIPSVETIGNYGLYVWQNATQFTDPTQYKKTR